MPEPDFGPKGPVMPRPDPRFDNLLSGMAARPQGGGLLQRAGAIVATLLVFGLALTFSVVVFAVVVTLGLVAWGYLWWKTRDLRKAMREQAAARGQAGPQAGPDRPGRAASGMVLEGEVIREVREDDPGSGR